MTTLEKPIVRRVQAGRTQLSVRLSAKGIEVRAYGARNWYPLLSWERLHIQAADLAAQANRKPRARSRSRLAVGV